MVLMLATFFSEARAQPVRAPYSSPRGRSGRPSTEAEAPTNVRARVGFEAARRLLASNDVSDRLRGIERLASMNTPEAAALLAREAGVQTDARVRVELARALGKVQEKDAKREGLLRLVNPQANVPRDAEEEEVSDEDDGDFEASARPVAAAPNVEPERSSLARDIAALALSKSDDDLALEALCTMASHEGPSQDAAVHALLAHPPRRTTFFQAARKHLSPDLARLLGELGDLRAFDVLTLATTSPDVALQAAAIVALAHLGDTRVASLARQVVTRSDLRLREAGARALVELGDPSRVDVVAQLLDDPASSAVGVELASLVHHARIVQKLAAIVRNTPNRALRSAAVQALGRTPDPNAAATLVIPELLADPSVVYESLLALARSPAPNVAKLLASLSTGPRRHLAARAWIVRSLVRGDEDAEMDRFMASLASSSQAADRALGVFARVANGRERPTAFLNDRDPRVRRSAILAGLSRPRSVDARALLDHARRETDEVTRTLLASYLFDDRGDEAVTTTFLVQRAESGAPDAAPAAYALARRTNEASVERVEGLLASSDPILRAHVARGLGASSFPRAAGLLRDAYFDETDANVRRAVVAALAERTSDADTRTRREVFETASDLDPDHETATIAANALARRRPPSLGAAAMDAHEVAWLRMTQIDGQPPGSTYAGMLLRTDGVAVPIAFDEDGFALVPGLPPGEVRLVLAPRFSSYESTSP